VVSMKGTVSMLRIQQLRTLCVCICFASNRQHGAA
jgi:hypothetical protein